MLQFKESKTAGSLKRTAAQMKFQMQNSPPQKKVGLYTDRWAGLGLKVSNPDLDLTQIL